MAGSATGRSLTLPGGFRAAGTTCGLKPSGDPDLALIVSDLPCVSAGVTTQSKCPGATVQVARGHLRRGDGCAIVCNSGIANVATGKRGGADAVAMTRQVADLLGCRRTQVLPASTGLIGEMLTMDKIGRGIATAAAKLGRGPGADAQTARAILTTDLVAKTAFRRVRLSGKSVTLAGIAKGSGMIAPNMATMLAFITTDAAVAPAALRAALRQAVGQSFNRVSIDDDTSTSDSVFVLANGAAANRKVTRASGAFQIALTELCRDLAYQIVADGEGATRVMRIRIKRAKNIADADRVGKAIASSPLVKTAVHGADPNWGRLIMAVGKSGAAVRLAGLSLAIADVAVCRRGMGVELAPPVYRKLVRAMRRKEVQITVDLGLGRAGAEWLGCDLSRQYVAINADYTT